MRALAFALLLGLALRADAAGFDGTTPLDCAPSLVTECDTDGACAVVPLAETNLPAAVRIDFAAKKMTSQDGARPSPVRSVDVEETVLIVQGSQNARGWSLVIDRATGGMSAAVAETEGAFLLTGSCTAP